MFLRSIALVGGYCDNCETEAELEKRMAFFSK